MNKLYQYYTTPVKLIFVVHLVLSNTLGAILQS